MSNKLFGIDIAKIVADNIGPGVLSAVLTVVTPGTRTPGQLTGGTNPTTATYACKGFIDSKAQRNRDGQLVSDGTEKVLLIGNTIASGTVSPSIGDKVTIEGATYTIEVVDRDPAGATFTLIVRKT